MVIPTYSEDDGEVSVSAASQISDASQFCETRTEWVLEYLDLENFKSYAGKVRVGPLRQFIAIIGPNGSGKSNLMDAISFVMGEKTASLRVRRLNELIHGAYTGRPMSSSAGVTAVFQPTDENSQEDARAFRRVIRGNSTDYFFNGTVVPRQKYCEELKKIGINPKGKNFLVFQGAIESIAMKNSKERALLIEEICGSGTLKEAYEKCKAEMIEADRRLELTYLKKKNIVAERKEAKLEVEEAKKYNQLLQEVNKKEAELCLFKLFHIEQEMTRLKGLEIITKAEVLKINKGKKRTEDKLAEKKRERAELSRELTSKEMAVQKMEKEKDKEFPQLKQITIQQKMKHLQKKLVGAEKSLKQAKESLNAQDEDLKRLQKSLEEVQNKESKLLELNREAQGPLEEEEGRLDVTFQESQMMEYLELKKQVIIQTKDEDKRKSNLEKKKKDKNDIFLSLSKQKKDIETQIELLTRELSDKKRFAGKASSTVQELMTKLKEKEAEVGPLREVVANAEERVTELQMQFEKVTVELGSMKIDDYENKRRMAKCEVLLALQNRFKGVKDRVINICKIRHPRFTIAMTKVIGNSMDAIVVDTEKTARDCIVYLKEQMREPEVFFPLDLLNVKPLKTRFRENEQRGMYLAFDLLEFDRSVEKAILYCTKSAVVCRTPEEASKVASGEIFGEATNAVTLEGTMYSVNGIISGGKANLERRAQTWNECDLAAKKEEKKKIFEALREATATTRGKVQVELKEQEIEGLKTRIKYAKTDFQKHETAKKQLENQIKDLQKELEDASNRYKDAEVLVAKINDEMRSVTKEIIGKEDQVFASFCEQVGIPNIRVYEATDVKAHEEFKAQREELQNEIERLKSLINYEQESRNSLLENVKRWEKSVEDIKNQGKQCKNDEEKMLEKVSEYEANLLKIREVVNQAKTAEEEKSKEIKEEMKLLIRWGKRLLKAEKELAHYENAWSQQKSEFIEILKHCKLSGIDINLVNGTLEDVNFDMESNSASVDSRDQNQESPSDSPSTPTLRLEVQISFEGLSTPLKQLAGDHDTVKKTEDEMKLRIRELETDIAHVGAPNLKAEKKWEELNSKAREQLKEFEEVRKDSKSARDAFEKVKMERCKRFNSCFEKVSRGIDGIYKALTQNQSAQAVLVLDNAEEPYLDGVGYHCVAPGKRFQSMGNLSGGEKTLAALALLFAIHSSEPSPFFVLDEVDAALDNTNIGKVTSFIKEQARNMQIVVISLKEELYEHAEALIGVAPDAPESGRDCVVSKLYTLDLTEYPDTIC